MKARATKARNVTMLFPLAENAPAFTAVSKYSVVADAPRVQGNAFSLSVPEGWVSVEDTGGRVFVLVPEGRESEGMESGIAILYGKTSASDDFSLGMREYGMPPVQWALQYFTRSHTGRTIEMHEVEARNCRCAVVQAPTVLEGTFEFHVYPYSLTERDYVRVTIYEPDDVTYGQARTFVDALARTVEIGEPTVPKCLECLEGRFMEARSAVDVWERVVTPIVEPLSALKQQVFESGDAFCVAANPDADDDERFAAGACALNQYLDVCSPYAMQLVSLFEGLVRTRSLTDEDRGDVARCLSNIEGALVLGPGMFPSGTLSSDRLALLRESTPRQQALLKKIEDVRAALGPSESEVTSDQHDPTATLCNLLLQRTLFFEAGDIAWDGRHHAIDNINLDAAQAEEMDEGEIQKLTGETVSIFGTVLTEIEKDEQLFVPRDKIADGIQGALPEGDLTGLTLCYLIGCGGAFFWKGAGDCYQLYFDPRLEWGIPQFFSLATRLIWGMRDQFLMSDRPFDITFIRTRNFDADAFLGEVDKRIAGAEDCPGTLHVTEPPHIDV